jgi:phosphoribosylaminoimidazolecarboxamide formyltransferase/IMP cyclohydrolase
MSAKSKPSEQPQPAPNLVPIKRALLSVSDKTHLADFAKKLAERGVEIISTGGTAKTLKDAGLKITDISEVTGFPEIMDGRVKTLHPKVHGGLLARRDSSDHKQAMTDHAIEGIDLLVVNLYPFVETVKADKGFDECIENIDVGGPAMIRAAAKNHDFVAVVTDPADYEKIIDDLTANNGATTLNLRRKLAAQAFALTAYYDSNIASWLHNQIAPDDMPERVVFSGTLKQGLRYGENPHQKAALYLDGSVRAGVATAQQVQGKELSYNNINDTDAAFELVSEFGQPTVAIIKHANPCGIATAKTMEEAYRRAFICDPTSAFGGIVALNRPLDKDTAELILKVFCEVIIAPSVNADTIDLLKTKPNVRVLTTGGLPDSVQKRPVVKTVAGGFLLQDCDFGRVTEKDFKVVTKRQPSAAEIQDMLFAFRVCKHVKSNAIVYAKDGAAVGIGAGQMSRIDSSRIAAQKSVDASKQIGLDLPLTTGSVVASDAFFPFADGLIAAAEAGVTAVIQPGGSIRDAEVIAAADERNLAMVFTGMRHFRH